MLEISMKLRRIVLAVDFSHGCAEATRVAMELATTHGAAIALVHAYELPLDLEISELLVNSGISVEESLAAAAEQALKGRADEMAARISSSTFLRLGCPAKKVHDIAADIGADLIVLGMYGRRGRANGIGSVAERVLRTTTRPVLLVPSPATET
jgi:nucleotide-binding universal stress UspA family protein